MLPFNEDLPLRSPQSPSVGHRVMLVDEDARDLKHFTSLLESMGLSVLAFGDHREAERCLEHGSFDLVIMCQGSPVLETHRHTRFTIGRNRYTPVVVLSRCPEIKCYVEAIQHGASDYLEKPLSPEELERLVTTYCKPRQSEPAAQAS
jgi:DNA-binding NtrC family response regulator